MVVMAQISQISVSCAQLCSSPFFSAQYGSQASSFSSPLIKEGKCAVRVSPLTWHSHGKMGGSSRCMRMKASAGVENETASQAAGACRGCGRPEGAAFGCNGEGRMMGGLGAVPGFGWWPIKAYRPCPMFIDAGGKYQRKGQSLEEVAFGRKASDDDLTIEQRLAKMKKEG
eukprot:TRINITY_DN22895_c0_g1_i1.p1 TRINITY_DN22895_c0_g1~~TRINITY_DN22895_c0_g1_i1.p1  ORF type:complete len:171 (-),score=20.95 TRINITY_DN22895_c0_g1_i1:41-553(-)